MSDEMPDSPGNDADMFTVGPGMANFVPSLPLIESEFADLNTVMRMIDWFVAVVSASDPKDWFPNNIAAHSLLLRAYSGLQAGAALCTLGFYAETRCVIRSVYEAAGLARTLAHSPDRAEVWLQGPWIKDEISRQFVDKEFDSVDGIKPSVAYSEFYKQASAYAHPKAVSTLGYLFQKDGAFRPKGRPIVNDAEFAETARALTTEAIFVAFTAKNSVSDIRVLPTVWLEDLSRVSRGYLGDAAIRMDIDFDAHEKLRSEMLARVRPASELDEELVQNPNSVHNLTRPNLIPSDETEGSS